jgi:N-acetylneuraminic acid mutarotase
MGGFDSEFKPVAGIDVYDPKTNKWTTISSGRIPAAETHAGFTVDGKCIYFAGGYIGALSTNRKQPVTDSVWRYDTRKNKWTRIASLPEARGAGQLVKVGRELHFFGGCGADRVTNYGDHWVLSLGRSTSGNDDGTRWIRKASLPGARDHLGGIAIGNTLYAIGGEFGHDVRHQQSNLFESFDPKRNKWTKLARLPVPRSHIESGVFVMNNKIIVAGGQVADYQPTKVVNEYDPKTGKWTTLTALPAARQGGLVHLIGNKVVVALGGVQTNEPQSTTWLGTVA